MWHITTNTSEHLYKILYWSGNERDISATIYFDKAKFDNKQIKFYRRNTVTGAMQINDYGHQIALLRELSDLNVLEASKGLK